jgi:hypothetical protein
MYYLFMHGRYDFWEHYHKRSNIETAYAMIKGNFGSHLRSKSDTRQINEALCKVLLAIAAGSTPSFTAGSSYALPADMLAHRVTYGVSVVLFVKPLQRPV